MAAAQRRRWVGDNTLNTTALIHEAYLKLSGGKEPNWRDRGHFLAVAATAMRHVLVNYAERRRAAKRGGGVPTVDLEHVNPVAPEVADEVIALHESLEKLARVNERQAKTVELRFFAGLSVEETAQTLGVSTATGKRDWSLASAWLHREIERALHQPPASP